MEIVKVIGKRKSYSTSTTYEVIVKSDVILNGLDSNVFPLHREKWFTLSISGTLEIDFDDLKISKIIDGTERKYFDEAMSQSMVPIIPKDKHDEEAERILSEYAPNALLSPTRLDPLELANNMGLTVEAGYLSDDFSIFGQVCFYPYTVSETFPWGGEQKCLITPGTIRIDHRNSYKRNEGFHNVVIVHECVHWLEHRTAVELIKKNDDNFDVLPSKQSRMFETDNWDAYDWMEWQANSIAPKILMPHDTFLLKAQEVIHSLLNEKQTDNMIYVIEDAILELSNFYRVTQIAVKIRLAEVGYSVAAGALIYIDGKCVPPYSVSEVNLSPRQTFSISMNDALRIYSTNELFRDAFNSGKLIFVESHFCINSPLYITKDESGMISMTEYGRSHMNECCLMFYLEVDGYIYDDDVFYSYCYLNRDMSSQTKLTPDFKEDGMPPNEAVDSFASDVFEVMQRIPASLSRTITVLRNWAELTQLELAQRSGMAKRSIGRLEEGDDGETKIDTIMQLIIGMNLPPTLSLVLIQKSGNSFKVNERDNYYQILLTSFCNLDLERWNKLLEQKGFKSLGRSTTVYA